MGESVKGVEDLLVHQKAVRLFEDFLRKDLPILQKSFAGRTLAGNQLRSLDSICANMEEGYDRKSGKEITNFFRIAKGSAGESQGRYKRFKFLLSDEVISERVHVLNEIRAILATLIKKWS